MNRHKRIMDGLLYLRIHKTFYQADSLGEPTPAWHLDPVSEDWSCGVEVELSLKSPARYRKQFRDLARQVYDQYNHDQHYPMLFFLYSTQTIRDKLVHQIKNGGYSFGNCVFFLAQIDKFTTGLGNATVERWIYGKGATILACEMSRVKILRS